MASNFFRDHRGIWEFVGKQDNYYVMIKQEDTKKLLDTENPDKEAEIHPIVFKLGIPIKRINGNVVKKLKLVSLPKESKILVLSYVMSKLTED